MAARDHAALRVEPRGVHRVQHGPDKLPRRAGQKTGVRVESEDVFHPDEALFVPGEDAEPAAVAAQEPRQSQQRPALALKAAPDPVAPARFPFAAEKVKSPAVFLIERRNSFDGGVHRPGIRVEHRGLCLRQVGQQAEHEVFPAVA